MLKKNLNECKNLETDRQETHKTNINNKNSKLNSAT